MRVVSLLASATEIVCALGLRQSLIGRSHECDFPPDVLQLPRCSDPSFAVEGTSRQIDASLKDAARQALSFYRVDELRLADLRPDVVITQTQCAVCAVSLEEVEAALSKTLRRDCRIVATTARRLADVYEDIRRIAAALGVPEKGSELVVAMKKEFEKISQAVRFLPRPRIAVLEWLDPLMACGQWIPELIAIAAGADVFAKPGERGRWLLWEDLRACDPDVLLAAPCGFPIARTRAEMAALARHPQWQDLKAVRQGRVYLGDGSQFFSRPGPRLVESAKILAEILHPGKADFNLAGSGWRPFL